MSTFLTALSTALLSTAVTVTVVVCVAVAVLALAATIFIITNRALKKESAAKKKGAKKKSLNRESKPKAEQPAESKPAQPAPAKPRKTPAPAPAPKPVKEEVKDEPKEFDEIIIPDIVPLQTAPVEETEDETVEWETDDGDAEEEETAGVMTIDDKRVHVIYRKSFEARLIQSKPQTKDAYAKLANRILTYFVHQRVSWNYHRFNVGRQELFKLNVRGKTLCLFCAMKPEEAENGEVKLLVTDSKKYEKTPVFMKVKSPLALKRALKLIDSVAESYGLSSVPMPDTVFADQFPYDTTEHLIERELIKYTVVKGELTEGAEIVRADIAALMRDKVTAEEAHGLIAEENVESLISEDDRAQKPKPKQQKPAANGGKPAQTGAQSAYRDNGGKARKAGRRYAVNVDTLSKNFAGGDTVDLQALKDKGLVPKSEKALKILARGTLDKPLKVYADDYSADAVIMIAVTGGKVFRTRAK